MKLKVNFTDINVHINKMQDGDIAVITHWGDCDEYIGRVVQRYKDTLISVGRESQERFSEIFTSSTNKECFVRILQPGDTITIQ